MRRAAAVLVLLVAALSGCGGTDTAPTARGWDAPVTVTRSGGIAGVQDEVTLQPEGGWRRTARGAAARTGTLPEAERNRVLSSMTDPALRAEMSRAVPDIACADAFEYVLVSADITVRWLECTPAPPVAAAVAATLLSGTD